MSAGLHRMTLADQTFGELRLLVAVPRGGDPWGVLAPLRDAEPWGQLIRVVSGESMAHARHGFSAPLMREIGPSPRHLLAMAGRYGQVTCSLAVAGTCAGASQWCLPHPKLPDCYEAPLIVQAAAEIAAEVTLAWRDGLYVLVVRGAEFNLG